MVGPSDPAAPALSQFDGPMVERKGFDDKTSSFREKITSIPLPPNAAQETLGNLDQVVDLLNKCLIELKMIRFATGTLASGGTGQMSDFDPAVNDISND